jgi:2-polyprenyl-3-methyl-5-hydroxy-6-metoxy-1,4-benzoquinol methylase
MSNSVIGNIYTNHHKKGERCGMSLFKDKRGAFLKENIGENKKILDIGCRDGVLTETYCKNNKVLGVDIDGEALETAKNNLGIEIKKLNLYDSWDLSSDFDVVVAGEILEHLYYPEEIIKKITKVLKPDGVLLGSIPNAFSLKNRVRLFFGNKKGTPLEDPTHINHYSYKEIKKILEKYFSNVNIYSLGNYAWLDKFWPGMFSYMLLFKVSNKKSE